MGVEAPDEAAGATRQEPASDKRLDRQQAYQHFHIGIYISIGSAIFGASLFAREGIMLTDGLRMLLTGALICLLIAGMCGGLVAANIPRAASHAELLGIVFPARLFQKRPGYLCTLKFWERWEHRFFWLAMLLLAWGGIAVIWTPAAPAPEKPLVVELREPATRR